MQQRGPIDAADARLRVVLIGAWTAATAALAGYVASFGTRMAMLDDLAMVGVLGGNGDLGWDHAWSQHNEHRIPLPKAVYVLAVDAARDFRAGTWITVAILSATALALVRGARASRGRASLADLAFPALLLHWGHSENLLNSFNVCFAIPVALGLCAALVASTSGERPPARRVALLGLLLAMQPLCGLVGLVQVPGLLAWTAWVGWRARRAGDRRTALAAAASVAAVLALCAAYFAGFRFLSTFRAPTLDRALVTALQFVAQGLGFPGRQGWPATAAAVAVPLGALGWLLARARTGPSERAPALALAAAIAGGLALAASVGWGRAIDGPEAGFANRYGLLAAPLACHALLGWAAFGARPGPRAAHAAVGLAGAALWLANVPGALAYGERRVADAAALDADLAAGATIARVARERWPAFFYSEGEFADALLATRAARLGPFGGVPPGDEDPLTALITRPSRSSSPQPFAARHAGGRLVVIAPAGSELVFETGGAGRLRARYGLYALAADRGRSDGLVVRVAWRGDRAAEHVLFERRLDPRVEGDSGLHALELDLPAEAGELSLRVDDEPGRVERHDWACWADVQLEGAR